jgi:hypothetical protein
MPVLISRILLLTACLWFLPLASASAQTTMTEVTPFDFGRFSLKNNTAPHELIVNAATNGVTADPPFVIDIDPQRGEYLLEGFDPGEEVTVTIDDGGLTLNGGGGTEVFATVDYTISPSPVIADGGGSVTFYVGATLRTLGNGVTYSTGNYQDDLDIQFDWIP